MVQTSTKIIIRVEFYSKEIGLDINGKDKSYIEVVKGWIKDTDPTSTQARKNKRNIYALCMALDMGIDEIKSFCLKYFLTIPFNFRDRTDVTFFYGINNGKSIVDIFELLDAPILNDDFCSGWSRILLCNLQHRHHKNFRHAAG